MAQRHTTLHVTVALEARQALGLLAESTRVNVLRGNHPFCEYCVYMNRN